MKNWCQFVKCFWHNHYPTRSPCSPWLHVVVWPSEWSWKAVIRSLKVDEAWLNQFLHFHSFIFSQFLFFNLIKIDPTSFESRLFCQACAARTNDLGVRKYMYPHRHEDEVAYFRYWRYSCSFCCCYFTFWSVTVCSNRICILFVIWLWDSS